MMLVIDSGIGGLSVLRALLDKHPNLSFIYHGDTKYAPYGEKSVEWLEARVQKIVEYFIKYNDIKTLVVACNTSASTVLPGLKPPFEARGIRVFDVISAAQALIHNGLPSGVPVGVLSTTRTAQSGSYQRMLEESGHLHAVVPCPTLVPLIEEGNVNGSALEKEAQSYVREILAQNQNIKHIILGCTHYPLMQHLFEKLFPEITFLDPGTFIQVENEDEHNNHSQAFYCSGNEQVVKNAATTIWKPLDFKQIVISD